MITLQKDKWLYGFQTTTDKDWTEFYKNRYPYVDTDNFELPGPGLATITNLDILEPSVKYDIWIVTASLPLMKKPEQKKKYGELPRHFAGYIHYPKGQKG